MASNLVRTNQEYTEIKQGILFIHVKQAMLFFLEI